MDEGKKVETGKVEKNTTMAAIAYILFFIPLLTDAKKDPFVEYHVKQGLGLLIFAIGLNVLHIIPLLGSLVAMVGGLCSLVFLFLGISNALGGKEKPLPLIGQFSEKISFGKSV